MLRRGFVPTAVLAGILLCLAVLLVGGTGSTIGKKRSSRRCLRFGPLADTAASHAFVASAISSSHRIWSDLGT